MGVQILSLFSSRMPVVAVLSLSLILPASFHCVRASPISESISLVDRSIHAKFQDSYSVEHDVIDTVLLSTRDLEPDILGTAIPIASPSPKAQSNFHPENRNLHLRSTSCNISGINGIRLWALPIDVSELTTLFISARFDLIAREMHAKTTFYEFNSTNWSFSVLTANEPLDYIYMLSIVSHFKKLSSSALKPTDQTTTIVGVVLNDTRPVADVTIMPRFNTTSNSYVPFSSFGTHSNNTPSTESVEIATFTPTEITCSSETLNETAALSPYEKALQDYGPGLGIFPRALETGTVHHVITEGFSMSVNMWHRPDGIPVHVSCYAIASLMFLALDRLSQEALKQNFLVDPHNKPPVEEMWAVDTGWFEMGRMAGRLVMEVDQRNGALVASYMTLSFWIRVLQVLLIPFTGAAAVTGFGWGMEGLFYWTDIDGTGNATKATNPAPVEIGRWELSFWDNT